MKFGPRPAADAAGTILAHSLAGSSGRVPKGTVLTPEHVADLQASGHDMLTVAALDPDDVEENSAAQTLAAAVVPDPAGQGLRISAAGAGRVNLYATGPGVVALDADRITAINSVDPMITIATVPPFHRVDEGTMIATIKIIAYAVPDTALQAATANAAHAIRVLAPCYSTATLIETQVGNAEPGTKGRAALTGRLDRLDIALSPRVVVPHRDTPLAQAVADAPGEVVFILTASATSDTHDVAPSAVRDAGGTVTAYGLPVDPGNLLFFGALGDKPVIGLPGCARSPALNGADWVLERLICGVTLAQSDISRMGVGGLLKEIPTRPRPRDS
ncbi:molybdopterin-binding protein [Tateyamaria omphalii]|uniref:Molybdopterin biosynthesis protein n=1 Tax=Tateyamaria omphalii TaxID=299262 RepID=A0A1P8MSZ7_9RHOB|nr:molybdopterin-binding protein [Tateyamaria omphalii]APX11200.1 molybdopterin biosynthesis protein [Tateyamaria omphalii]